MTLTPKMQGALERLKEAGPGWHSLAKLGVAYKTAEALEKRRLVLISHRGMAIGMQLHP